MREDTLSIRPATEDDLAAVLAIEQQCYRSPSIPWTEEAFRVELTKPFAQFLALTDDATDSIVTAYIVFGSCSMSAIS